MSKRAAAAAVRVSTCLICDRPDRDRLDERLALDLDTVWSLAEAEGLPFEAVWRHRARHLDIEWMAIARGNAVPLGTAQLRAIATADLHDIRGIARDPEQRPRARIDAHGAVRGWIELLVKMVDHGGGSGSGGGVSAEAVAELVEGLLSAVAELPGGRAVADAYLEQVARTIPAIGAGP